MKDVMVMSFGRAVPAEHAAMEACEHPRVYIYTEAPYRGDHNKIVKCKICGRRSAEFIGPELPVLETGKFETREERYDRQVKESAARDAERRAEAAAEHAEAAAQWAAVKARYNDAYFTDKIFIIGEWHPVRPGYIVREARDVDGNNYVAIHKGNTPPTNPADYAVFDAAGKVVQRTVTPLPWGMTQQEHAASNAFASLPEAISAMCECSYSISQSLLPAILAGAETWEDVAAAVAKWEKDDAEAPFDPYGTPTVYIAEDEYAMGYTTVSGTVGVDIRLVSEFPGGPDIWEIVCEIYSHNDFHKSSAMASFAAAGWHCYNKNIRLDFPWMDKPEEFREAYIRYAEDA